MAPAFTRILTIATVAVIAATGSLAAAPAAHADRCNPEEFVMPPLTSEENSPFCVVMLDVVYPALACDRTTLMRCLQTIDPVATAANAPATAAATPGRAVGAANKIPDTVPGARSDICSQYGSTIGMSNECRPVR